MSERTRRGVGAARLALAVSGALVVVKITAGLAGRSYALVADGVESSLDIVSSLIVWRGVTVASRDPDDRYHFGYGKAESIAAATIALMLVGAAAGIAVAAAGEIVRPRSVPEPYTLLVLVGVIAVKEGLYRRLSATGAELESRAIAADAWHQRSDAITSAAAFVGITLALVGGPGWAAADAVAALIASGVIALNGIRILAPALQDLMDRAPDPDVLVRVERTARAVQGVRAVEKIQARRAGAGYFVALHIEADPDMTLRAAHELGHRVKDAVLASMPSVLDVLVHMEPCQTGEER